MVNFRLLRVALLVVLFMSSPATFAVVCKPGVPHYLFVGDTANCDYGDIQSAIDNVVCPGTIVTITQAHGYMSQALRISDKSLALVGAGTGVGCGTPIGICDPTVGCGSGGAPPPPAVTLTGNGSTSVISVSGTSAVTLQSLAITGGGGTQGGGVQFVAAGALTLIDSSIVNDSAAYGGGIYLAGMGGTATLTLGTGTIIEENSADSDGGGIYLAGATHLLALAPYTFIGYNHAPNGSGGGIAIAGPPPAQADIGSPGYNGAPVIEFNDAAHGGGIALVAKPPGKGLSKVFARLFTTDPNNPGAISDNTATSSGGGVYIKSGFDPTSGPVDADFSATNFRVDSNVAAEGTAINVDPFLPDQYGTGYVEFNPLIEPPDNYGATLASLGSVNCAPGTNCNTLSNNAALDASNQPTSGAAIFLSGGGTLDAERFLMRFNQGGNAIHLFHSYGAKIFNCLLADNTESGELVRTEMMDTVIDSCTFARNSLGGPTVIYNTGTANSTNAVQDSIIDQPGWVTLNAGSYMGAALLLSNDLSTLSSGLNIQGAPMYVDAASGDYHLQLGSLGVDYAFPSDDLPTDLPTDLDGVSRVFDIPNIPNAYGPRDLGAYERHPSCYRPDTLLCDGFDGIY